MENQGKKTNEGAGELFGRVVLPEHIEKIQTQRLLVPFEWKDAVAYFFCKKCSTILEVNKELSENMVKQAGLDLPETLEGLYFEASGCQYCSKENQDLKLKKIQEI
jgi:hypothetical protein